MPKKTFYTKEDIAKQAESKKQEEVPVSPTVNIKNDIEKEKIDIEKELQTDTIVKQKQPKLKVIKRRARSSIVDENGRKLKQDGTVDKRGETGLKNLQKSRVYQQILEQKKAKEKVAVTLTPYVESSDSETEFDEIKLETVEPTVETVKPTVEPTVEHKGTNDFIKKQEIEREKILNEQLRAMELENKKLKDSFHYNSHLNRIQTLSTNVKLKF